MAVYDRETCARSFNDDLLAHLMGGFVYSTPDYFIMGRPVMRSAPQAQIVDPTVAFPKEDCDTWHIYLLAGDPRPAWSIMPWPLAWFSFERGNELRFYPVDRIKRLFPSEDLSNP